MLFNDSGHKTVYQFRLQPATAEQMKACPFCGHRAAELRNTHTPHYWVECGSCGAEVPDPKSARGDGPRSHRASAFRAIDAWNTRHTADPLIEIRKLALDDSLTRGDRLQRIVARIPTTGVRHAD